MTSTTRLKFRPELLDDSWPNTTPITISGRANQLAHPRKGMVAGMTMTSETIPNRIESRLSMCPIWITHHVFASVSFRN